MVRCWKTAWLNSLGKDLKGTSRINHQEQFLIVIIEGLHGGVETVAVPVHHIVLVVSVPCGERLVVGVGPHVVVEVVASP